MISNLLPLFLLTLEANLGNPKMENTKISTTQYVITFSFVAKMALRSGKMWQRHGCNHHFLLLFPSIIVSHERA